MRERDPLYWVDTLWQDIRFAFRLIARNKWLSVTIVATLTIGIALNVSVFSLLNGSLLRPWVRSEPETFVSVIPRYSGEYRLRFSIGGMSQPDYGELPRFGEVAHGAVCVPSAEPHAQRSRVGQHSRRTHLLQRGGCAQARAPAPRPLSDHRRVRSRRSHAGRGAERVRMARSIRRRYQHCREDHPSQPHSVHRRRCRAQPGPARTNERLRCLDALHDAWAVAAR